ncbi:hypothetical protein TNCV_2730331 [Trichonephila clavipes]|nr:hypothetical protein TNCV_2730331 [Trichonephila clavipes]
MSLLSSDDLGSGTRMLKAIRSKDAPTLCSCNLPLVRILGFWDLLCVQQRDYICHTTSLHHSPHSSCRRAYELFVGSS